MDIKDNKNFKSVCLYNKNIYIKDIFRQDLTKHLSKERLERFYLSINQNKNINGQQAEIDKVFLVDKGHKDGAELHCVTKRGIIFILNQYKYENNLHSFITILFARPNQISRLYKECGLTVSSDILKFAEENVHKKLNK